MSHSIFNWLKTKAGFGREYLDDEEIRHLRSNPELTEAVTQRGSQLLLREMLARHKAERRWNTFRRSVIAIGMVLGLAYSGLALMKREGLVLQRSSTSTAGVVAIHGNIMQTGLASAEQLAPTLAEAFDNPSTKVVVLDIDSPGGQPNVSEQIINLINAKKKATGKPVVAVIANTGASAAYMIALAADKIVAGRYSLVGSIGAKLSTWDFSKAIERYDVRQTVYASGTLKNMLDPWAPPSTEASAKAQLMVNQLGQAFLKDVVAARGKRLKPGIAFGTGEVWVGEEAKALGLIDEIGTIDQVIQSYNVKPRFFGPRDKGPLSFMSSSADWLGTAISNGISKALLAATSPATVQ